MIASRLWKKVCSVAVAACVGLALTVQVSASAGIEPSGVNAGTGTGAGMNVQQAALGNSVDLSGLEALSDQFMRGRTGADDPPGTAIVVVQDGRIVFQKGYGYADVSKKTAVDPAKTVFRVGSVTKVFTAAAIMKLVEQGKIDLKVDVQKYMGGLKLDNPFHTPVTVHDLLTHTSGFQVTVEPPEFYTPDLNSNVSLKDFVEQRMPPVVREPGTSYMYDNFAFNLLGFIVENVSGISFEQYVKENILNPLQMKNTEIAISDQKLQQLAIGYGADNKAIPPYATTPREMADGGMLMTAEDAARFMIAQLNGGKVSDTQIWSKASIEKMQQFQTGIHQAYPDATYGFENLFEANKNNGLHVIGKGGDVPGFSAYMLLMPEKNIGIFLVHNKMGASTKLAWAWYTMFVDQYFPIAEGKPVSLSTPVEQLKRFEGVYTDLRMNFLLTNVAATGPGELTVEILGQSQKLKQIDPLLFIDERGRILAFKEESNGTISYLKYMNPVSYAQKASATFSDVERTNVYASPIGQLKAMGILRGTVDGRFHPKRPVTRADMTAWMVRMMGLTLSKKPVRYEDAVGMWAAREIETAAEAGLVQGVTDKSFAPDQSLTRQGGAEFFLRALQGTTSPEQLAELPLDQVKLAQPGDPEADMSMKVIIAMGLSGSDVTVKRDGAVDFRPKDPLTREEAAYWSAQFISKFIMGAK
ncbi:serine hydrolase [Paenibacillus guangzhouensis]|uniref:serine hydrolase n=1 Tax=Paenibacillus guangzhouensis TaxID=1473112 RepID=UPI00187B86C6|nr:serine hydrolase [Paenibacillus guangzhouensis]